MWVCSQQIWKLAARLRASNFNNFASTDSRVRGIFRSIVYYEVDTGKQHHEKHFSRMNIFMAKVKGKRKV